MAVSPRKRYFVFLQLLASVVGVVQLLAVLLPEQLHSLFRHPDALQLSWYAAILILLISFTVGFLLLVLSLWRKQLKQTFQWFLVASLGLGLALFFWSATTFLLMGSVAGPGPVVEERMEAQEKMAADSLARLHRAGRRL